MTILLQAVYERESMTKSGTLLTAEEFWAMPKDDKRYELIDGEVREMPPTSGMHGQIELNMGAMLRSYARAHQLGVVMVGETGFIVKRNPDRVRGADVAFVRQDRIPATGVPESFWDIPPDLAVEVLSASDTVRDVVQKVDDWLAAGTPMVWVLNAWHRTVTIYRFGQPPLIRGEADTLEGDPILHGFRCLVRELFE